MMINCCDREVRVKTACCIAVPYYATPVFARYISQ